MTQEMVPYEPFDTLVGRFHQLFSSPRGGEVRDSLTTWAPRVDVYDRGGDLVLEADLPGFSLEDIDIRVEDQVLTLSGERAWPQSGETRSYIRSERPFGRFARSFTLPVAVDSQKIDAIYRHGVLTVTMPKSEAWMPRRIDVQVS